MKRVAWIAVCMSLGACGSVAGGGQPENDGGASPSLDAPAATDGPPMSSRDMALAADTSADRRPDQGMTAMDGPRTDTSPGYDAGPEPPTFSVRRGNLLFSDDFNDGNYRPQWQLIGGDWNVVDGRAVGSQPAGDPDPTLGHMMPVERVVLQFSFMYTGTGRPGTRFNHRNPNPANNHHLVNVDISPTMVIVREQMGWSTTTRTVKTVGMARVTLDPGKWYTAVLEAYDTGLTFSIDGQMLVSGTTGDQSATPRNHFVLEAYGNAVSYDDVKVWEAIKPP